MRLPLTINLGVAPTLPGPALRIAVENRSEIFYSPSTSLADAMLFSA